VYPALGVPETATYEEERLMKRTARLVAFWSVVVLILLAPSAFNARVARAGFASPVPLAFVATAHLTGGEEVPPVATPASGTALY
jgi:hypothetical protein